MRGRYRAILIDSEEYLLAVARYIHHNPVEARVVRNIDEYRWRLGGYKLREIGQVVGLEKYSSVSTAYLRMQERIAKERNLRHRALKIEKQLLKSQEQT